MGRLKTSDPFLSIFCIISLFPYCPLCWYDIFTLFTQIYLLAPKSALGNFIKKPFIKFICHTASYLTFLFLLLLASQHIARTNLHMQGPPPTIVEWMILPWVLGMCKRKWHFILGAVVIYWCKLCRFFLNKCHLLSAVLFLSSFKAAKETCQTDRLTLNTLYWYRR